jgi:hypothetical protein
MGAQSGSSFPRSALVSTLDRLKSSVMIAHQLLLLLLEMDWKLILPLENVYVRL